MAIISIKFDVEDKNINQKIDRITKKLSEIGDEPGGFIPSFDVSNLPGALRQVATLQGSIGAISNLGAPGRLAAVGLQLGEMAYALGKTGAEVLRTSASFDNLATRAGISSGAMLASTKAMSRGTIADSDLVMAANRALVLDVADSADEMGRLVEAAIVRGRDVGVGATQAVNDLVTGIGRMSPEILDNLGIANAKSAFDDYAKTLGTTADKLTDVQKKQALVNAVLASTQGVAVVDDAAAAFERMDASIKNAQEALGVLFSPAATAIANKLAEAAAGVTDAITTDKIEAAHKNMEFFSKELQRLVTEIQNYQSLADGFEFLDAAKADIANTKLAELRAQIVVFGNDYNRAAAVTGAGLLDIDALQRGEFALQTLAAGTQTAANAAKVMATATDLATASISRMAGVMNAAQGAVDTIRGKLVAAAAGAMGASQAFATFQQYKNLGSEVDYLGQSLANLGYYDADQITFLQESFLAKKVKDVDDLVASFNKLNDAASSTASGGLSQLDQAFSALEGKVSSVLQGALQTDVAVNGQDGGYQDAINENARRLAAIANEGFANQPWLDEFRQEVGGIFADLKLTEAAGGDVKAAAAALFKDFQDGLVPELIDKDMAKERVKRMILGEQSMAALAGEIAGELAQELGISLSDAQAATQTALGVKPNALAADKAGDGAAASGQAQKFVSTWVLDMNSQYTRIYATGVTSGEQWGQGMLTGVKTVGVPNELVTYMAVLITPEVLRLLRLQGSQTGANP